MLYKVEMYVNVKTNDKLDDVVELADHIGHQVTVDKKGFRVPVNVSSMTVQQEHEDKKGRGI